MKVFRCSNPDCSVLIPEFSGSCLERIDTSIVTLLCTRCVNQRRDQTLYDSFSGKIDPRLTILFGKKLDRVAKVAALALTYSVRLVRRGSFPDRGSLLQSATRRLCPDLNVAAAQTMLQQAETFLFEQHLWIPVSQSHRSRTILGPAVVAALKRKSTPAEVP